MSQGGSAHLGWLVARAGDNQAVRGGQQHALVLQLLPLLPIVQVSVAAAAAKEEGAGRRGDAGIACACAV